MLTEEELGVIEHYARWTSESLAMGMEYKDRRLHVSRSRRLLLYNVLYLSMSGFLVAYSSHRLYSVLVTKTVQVKLPTQVIYVFLLIYASLVFMWHVTFALQRKDLVALFNQLMAQHEKRLEDQPQHNSGRGRTLIYLHKVFNITCAFGAVFLPLVEFLTAWKFHRPFYPFQHALLHFINVGMAYTIFGLIQMYLFLYFTIVMQVLRVRDSGGGQLKANVTMNAGAIREYRTVMIVGTLFNQSYCKVLVPLIKYVLSVLTMFCMHGAIRLALKDPTILPLRVCLAIFAIYCMLALNVAASATSELTIKSSEYLRQARAKKAAAAVQTTKYDSLILKSLSPLRFGVAGLYYMDKEARLTLISFVINSTMSMLLVDGE